MIYKCLLLSVISLAKIDRVCGKPGLAHFRKAEQDKVRF